MHACRRSSVALALALAFSVSAAGGGLAQTPYPPQTGENAFVTQTRVGLFGCVDFGGGPFVPGSTVTITDNDAPRPSAVARSDGNFVSHICFGATATIGIHVLVGRGPDGAPFFAGRAQSHASRVPGVVRFSRIPFGAAMRRVTAPLLPQAVPPPSTVVEGSTRVVVATVIVLGLRTRVVEPGKLPRTGSSATVPMVGVGIALLLTGSGLTVLVRTRKRRALSAP